MNSCRLPMSLRRREYVMLGATLLIGAALVLARLPESVILCVNVTALAGILLWLLQVNHRGADKPVDARHPLGPMILERRSFSERLTRFLASFRHGRTEARYRPPTVASFDGLPQDITRHRPRANWWIRLFLNRIRRD